MHRLLAGLFVLAGFSAGGSSVARLPGVIQRRVRRGLLPLESAARRLIFFVERRLPATPAPKVTAGPTAKERSTLGYLSKQMKKKNRKRAGAQCGTRAAVFWLCDKPRYCPLTADPHRRPPRGGAVPRIWLLDGSDPLRAPPVKPTRDDGDARKLFRRLQGLLGALDDMPGQALRLRRLMARRKAKALKRGSPNPIREGAPPGYRYDGKGEQFDLLRGCHRMAQEDDPPPVV